MKNNKAKTNSKQNKSKNVGATINNQCVNICRIYANGRQEPQPHTKEKYYDVTNSSSILSSGSVWPLTDVSQGIGISARTGDNLTITDLFVNYSCQQFTTDVFSTVRIIIVQFVQNTSFAGAPSVAMVLQSAAVDSMYAFQFSNQIRVIYDAVHFLSGSTSTGASSANIGYYGKLPRKYNPNLEYAAAATAGSNKIYAIVISDSAVAPSPTVNMQSRITFSDD